MSLQETLDKIKKLSVKIRFVTLLANQISILIQLQFVAIPWNNACIRYIQQNLCEVHARTFLIEFFMHKQTHTQKSHQ